MKQTAEKDLAYYKAHAEEDYLQVPISVLRYISQLEQAKEIEKKQQGYSEEEVLKFILTSSKLPFANDEERIEWFNKFKNTL